jgi:hypothetical protein
MAAREWGLGEVRAIWIQPSPSLNGCVLRSPAQLRFMFSLMSFYAFSKG